MNLLEKFNLGILVITPAAMNELDQNSVINSLIIKGSVLDIDM